MPRPSDLQQRLDAFFIDIPNWLDFAHHQPDNALLIRQLTEDAMKKYEPLLHLMDNQEFALVTHRAVIESFHRMQDSLGTVLENLPTHDDGDEDRQL